MANHVIVGAGAIGATTARLLADAGHDVTVVTRNGAGPRHDRIRSLTLDATDADVLTAAVDGAVAVYQCANPPTGRWRRDWPGLARAVLTTAERTGAVHVGVSDISVYGAVRGRVAVDQALYARHGRGHARAEAWADALAAHRNGSVRAVEVRTSDLVGPHTDAGLVGYNMWRMLYGRTLRWAGDPRAVHSYTAVIDVARLLAVVGTDARAWGRAWHVPSPTAVDAHLLFREFAAMAGVPRPRIRTVPAWMLRRAAGVSPTAAALADAGARLSHDVIVDASPTTATFGIEPTPLRHSLTAMLAAARGLDTTYVPTVTNVNGVRC